MNVHFLTPFPKMVDSIIGESILARAQSKGYVNYNIHNLFDYADEPHCRIDDYPFGGGSGMVMKPEPVFRAFDEVSELLDDKKSLRVIYPTPDGKALTQALAQELSTADQLIFINGHYKGIDQRIRDYIVTDEISIGDYVLTGGELASAVILDSVIRLIPGVLNNIESADSDSFSHPLLDAPHYTRLKYIMAWKRQKFCYLAIIIKSMNGLMNSVRIKLMKDGQIFGKSIYPQKGKTE